MKKFKNLVSFFMAAVLIASMFLMSGTALAAEDPAIEAKSAILVEVGSGEVLYDLNANEILEPASTTKIMTLLLAVEAIESGDLAEDDMIIISENATANLPAGSSTAELTPGEEISMLNLLYCAALSSANEGCNAIAEAVSGSIDVFVRQMNARAKELGCENTKFVNPHGLSADGHYTTAYDLYLMLNEAYKHELFVKITGTSVYTVPSTNAHIQRSLTNTNKLIDKNSDYYYENVKCGKTGSTDAAGYCLATVANDSKLTLISVVMGAEYKSTDNGGKIYQHFSESRRLLEWGFNNFSYRYILDTSNLLAEVPILMGEGSDSVVLHPEESITLLVENTVTPDDDITYDITVYSEENDEDLVAPVSAGDVLGEVEVFYKGESQGVVKLIANSTVPLLRTEYLKAEFGEALSSGWIRGAIFFIIIVLVLYIGYVVYYNIAVASKKKSASTAAAVAEFGNETEGHREKTTTGKKVK
ncbi:MAG: D-alanyl-D-alanine carboxypeptidase [Ruminococcaceae bacterium]|nr:D-alanyl-D-alanine carboxypeptidase [Oscillospiraceae bacterium]